MIHKQGDGLCLPDRADLPGTIDEELFDQIIATFRLVG